MKKEDDDYKKAMESSRLVATHIWNASGRVLKRQEWNAEKLIPFVWDKKERRKQTTQEMMSVMFGAAAQQNAYIKKVQRKTNKNAK